MHKSKVVVLDFGSQVSRLIVKAIRRIGVYAELIPFNADVELLNTSEVRAIVLSGGPSSVSDAEAPMPHPDLFNIGKPILGICYGLQVMARILNGSIAQGSKREYGRASLIFEDDPLFEGIDEGFTVWMSHFDQVVKLPEGFISIAHTKACTNAAVRHRDLPIYGLQFHPEVVHTEHGERILENFLKISGEREFDWKPSNFLNDTIEWVREETKGENVLCGLSGGVDSTVLAVILHKAVGNKLRCFFIDNGLLRLNEAEEVMKNLTSLNLPVDLIDAQDDFLKALEGIEDPEEKRKIIGRVFIETFSNATKTYRDFKYLAQGTLYPDVIESVSFKGPAVVIKSHHNVGGLPKDVPFRLIEPFRELFKDEVRMLGRELGMPEHILNRHPFPGPGLAVRILGSIDRESLDILRKADDIFISEMKASGLYDYVWQGFAVLLPIRSVGVMGDMRTYDRVIALRAVTGEDGMTADWARLPLDFLAKVSNRIINEVQGINRVVYDLSSKPPATIEWE